MCLKCKEKDREMGAEREGSDAHLSSLFSQCDPFILSSAQSSHIFLPGSSSPLFHPLPSGLLIPRAALSQSLCPTCRQATCPSVPQVPSPKCCPPSDGSLSHKHPLLIPQAALVLVHASFSTSAKRRWADEGYLKDV